MTIFKPEEKELDQRVREAEGYQYDLIVPEAEKEIPIYCDCECEACPHCG